MDSRQKKLRGLLDAEAGAHSLKLLIFSLPSSS